MATFMGTVVLVLAVYIAFNIALLRLRTKMHKREAKLRNSGVTPSGSGLCHGMKLSTTSGGVIRDSKKSSAWYSRLA
jgi:hypothetical protein